MQTISRLVGGAAALALLAGVLLHATRAGEPKTPPSPQALLQAIAEAGKPGPEHKKLQPLVGNWTFTMKFFADPSQPPAELTGTIERKWIMDGRFIQETARGTCAKTGKTFEGLGLVGYNAAEKRFTLVKACNLSGIILSGPVTCDSSGTRFECVRDERCPLTHQKVKGRDELLIESNDRIVLNVYKTLGDREVKIGEMVSIRQK